MFRKKVAVIGLGYVGLPLALELGKKHPTLGYDVLASRVAALSDSVDNNGEHTKQDFLAATQLAFTHDQSTLADCDTFIITVPTPVAIDHKPDITYLQDASKLVASYLKPGDLVIYESTVYPGATEDDCLPILESISGLKVNEDFGLGYSPERINPGDKTRPIHSIQKITSGSNSHWAQQVDQLYQSIITAGTHLTSSIKVAEAAKVIENTQRDLNIAFMNQLAQLFCALNIDTHEVLAAAQTKWNFLPFKPGLVGGHCISVDPYYLCHKAESVGYIPDIILAGRKLNDGMGAFIANETIKLLTRKAIAPHSARLLIAGITFKENCPDIRNSRVLDIKKELEAFSCHVDVYDPIASKPQVEEELNITLLDDIGDNSYDGLIVAVAHTQFHQQLAMFKSGLKPNHIIYDLKAIYDKEEVTRRL